MVTREFVMKKFIVALMALAVIGFGMAACGGDDDNGGTTGGTTGGDIFAGTWKNDEMGAKIVAASGSFTMYSIVEEGESSSEGDVVDNSWESADARGTYTVSGSAVSCTITEVNLRDKESDADNWKAYADLTAAQKAETPQTITGTVSGSTFTASVTLGGQTASAVFTK